MNTVKSKLFNFVTKDVFSVQINSKIIHIQYCIWCILTVKFLMSWSVSFSESWVSSLLDRLVGVLGAVSVLSGIKKTISHWLKKL